MDNRSANSNRLLVIDDDPRIGAFIAKVALPLGFETRCSTDGVQFKEAYSEFKPTLIVTDLQMPGIDGIQLLRFLGEVNCTAAILIVSGVDSKTISTANDLGSVHGLHMIGFLQKPVAVAELRNLLKSELDAQRTITQDDLRDAIDTGQLTPYYQPKATRNSQGKWIIDSVESLIRWPHAQFGMVMPDEFIPLAEETGLIVPLTHYVIEAATEQMVDWRGDGLKLGISVNLSANVLTEVDFPDRLSSLMAENELDNQMLTLEITESAAMNRPDLILDILSRFRLKGFSLSMDDFGTGYSSMKQLFKLPFSELKIDRSFVVEVDHNQDARTMTTAMVTLAHQLGLTVCAEGVETQEALDFLGSVDCDRAQGYLISRPVPASQIPTSLKAWGKS